MLRALRVPPVRVKVLAARPHAKWGELHGLYETAKRPGLPPIITLWMRTARQKRVVAFRTFLRTLLHEIGHHLDYTLLRLGDSFHTQGFYQRESHLFHQLVTDGGIQMASLDEQMARMERTAHDFAAAIKGASDAQLSKRPDDTNWSAKEVVCHVRDTEESFMIRFQTVMAMDEPKFLGIEPDRWAIDRQYSRNDVQEALEAFRARRDESLKFLRGLAPEQWERGGVHATRQGLRRSHGLARRQPPRPAQARPRRQGLIRRLRAASEGCQGSANALECATVRPTVSGRGVLHGSTRSHQRRPA